MKEKTYVADVDRSLYDFRNDEKDTYRVQEGLTPEIVEQISQEKKDPEWMKEFRLKSLKVPAAAPRPRRANAGAMTGRRRAIASRTLTFVPPPS